MRIKMDNQNILKKYKIQPRMGNCKDCKFSQIEVYTGYLMPKDAELLLSCHATPVPWNHAFLNHGIENFDYGCGMFQEDSHP